MARDPLKYFRIEARELRDGIERDALSLEREPANREPLSQILRLAHTLKGAARVVRQPHLADLAHAIEEVLIPSRDARSPVPAPQIRDILALVDQLSLALTELPSESPPPDRPTARPPDLPTSIRLDSSDLDGLLEHLAETSTHLASLDRKLADADLAAARVAAGRARAELAAARERAQEARLAPAELLLAPLARVARDAAQEVGRDVELTLTGQEHRADAAVLSALAGVLPHLVRNAVVHGVEPKEARVAAGKPEIGRVHVGVERHADTLRFRIEDDGRGLDLAAIRRTARARGLLDAGAAERLDHAAAAALLLKGGVSTAPALSGVAGRGVGMDAVRAAVERLRGSLAMESQPGRGARVTLTVPVAVAAHRMLFASVGGLEVSLPLDFVRVCRRIAHGELVVDAQATYLPSPDGLVPFAPLAERLERAGGPGTFAVVLEHHGERVAVGVDRLAGTGTVVVRPLPARATASPVVAGAWLDAAGVPQLVLDAGALVRARAASPRAEAPAPRERLPVLVVDDSLTTRMMEQSILESEGFAVDCATSAEEGWEMAHRARYALFIVDVEMPGMDGFEFVTRVTRDPVLAETPAILVSSRAAPEDLRRGRAAGARAHIDKFRFDQVEFLRTVRELVGA